MLIEHVIKHDEDGEKSRNCLSNISNTLLMDDRESGTASGVSCTSVFTDAALELHDKLRRKKKKWLKKRLAASNEAPEVSEEYDIQTIVSGLTRNSEFPEGEKEKSDFPEAEERDSEFPDEELPEEEQPQVEDREIPTPISGIYYSVDHGAEDWPDDESKGLQGRNLLNITRGDQVPSKDSVRYNNKEDPASVRHEEDVEVKLRSKAPAKEAPRDEDEIVTSKKDEIIRNDLDSRKEAPSSEPEGSKYYGRPQAPLEPSGMKMETLFLKCATKNEIPSRRSATAAMNDQNVELIYREEKVSRRRSKSTNAARRTRNSGYPLKDTNEERKSHRSRNVRSRSPRNARSHSADGKKRSRSLPRTLKRITSRFKGQELEFKGDPLYPRETLTSPLIDGTIRVGGNFYVSPLGSQCDGIESKETPTKYWRHAYSPHPCEEECSQHSSNSICEDSEPRVCVEFSRKSSGGYYQTTCVEDQKSTDSANWNRQEENLSRGYPITRTKTRDDAPKILYPGYDRRTMDPPSQNIPNNSRRDRTQIDAVAEKASRNSLLSPNDQDDSYVENDDVFGMAPRSRFVKMKENSEFATTESKNHAVSVTPSYEKELRQEFPGQIFNSCLGDPGATLQTMTSANRKDLIQRYLSLRDQHSKSNASNPPQRMTVASLLSHRRGRSVGAAHTGVANRILQDHSDKGRKENPKSVYDDASMHYQLTESEDNQETNIKCHSEIISGQLRRYAAPLPSSATKSIRRSDGMGVRNDPTEARQNLFAMPDAYKHQTTANANLTSPQEVSSFPYLSKDRLSYSYVSDDSSTGFPDGYNPNENSPYPVRAQSNYLEELKPHKQFMINQMGIGD